MKNRFYGDINDYIKYGILDIFAENYQSIGIHWYLTDDQHGKQGDGGRIGYLDKENKWKNYNPRIFDQLKKRVKAGQRNISYCRLDKIINFKNEFYKQIPDNAKCNDYKELRTEWHNSAKEQLKECDLVFFDPDIGVIDMLSNSVVKNSEYCLVKEIEDYKNCDWLIVIFPKHAKRYQVLKSNPIVKSAESSNKKVMVFIYGGMVLLYVSDIIQTKLLARVFEKWDTRIKTKILVP